MMIDAQTMLRACGGSKATAYRRFAVAVLLAGPRAVQVPTRGRRATLVPVDCVARVLGLCEADVLALAGVEMRAAT